MLKALKQGDTLWLDVGDGPQGYGYKDLAMLKKKLDAFWDQAFELMDDIDRDGPPNINFNMAHESYDSKGGEQVAVLSYDDEESAWHGWDKRYRVINILEESFSFKDAVIQGAGLELGRSILKELWLAADDVSKWFVARRREQKLKKEMLIGDLKRDDDDVSESSPPSKKKKTSPCVYHALGKECKKGNDCNFRHDLTQEEAKKILASTPCRNLQCKKGPKSGCLFSHPKQKERKEKKGPVAQQRLEETMGPRKRYQAITEHHDCVGMVFYGEEYHAGCYHCEDKIFFTWHEIDDIDLDLEFKLKFGEKIEYILTKEQKKAISDQKSDEKNKIICVGVGQYAALYYIPDGGKNFPTLKQHKGDIRLNEDIHLVSWRNTNYTHPSAPSGQITGVRDGQKEFIHNIPTAFGDCGYPFLIDGTRSVIGVQAAGLTDKSTGGQAMTYHLFQ
jgi:hypothetical protein